MSVQPSMTVKSTTHGALIDDLRLFITATTTKTKITTVELTKSCLFLLKHLPASRSASLHCLKSVFDSVALNHIIHLEVTPLKQKQIKTYLKLFKSHFRRK